MALALLAMLHMQWRVYQLLAELPVADDQGQVVLLHLTLPEAFVQLAQGAAAFRHYQATRSFPIDAMSQRQVPEVRPRMAQQLDDTMAYAAAAMHCDTGRLIQYQQALVLIEHPIEYIRRHLCRGRRAGRTDSSRGNSYLIAFHELVFRFDPTAVDTHLTAPQQAIQAAFGHAG